jgi:hypothetical protein
MTPRIDDHPAGAGLETTLPVGSEDGGPGADGDTAPARVENRHPLIDATDGPRLTLPQMIDREARGYLAWGTPVGDFLARKLDELSQLVRWTQATTPDEHDARMDVWDAEIRDQWEARGYEEGQRSVCDSSASLNG